VISFNIIPVTSTDSTNNHLKKLLGPGNLPEGTVILADHQSKGRGRGENRWYSGKNMNILMSVLLKPGIQAEKFFFLTEVASLALADLLKEFDIYAEIKWPNDIYRNEKKLAGLLIENILISDIIETTIIGIGLNVNEEVFPENLPNPISIKNITGIDHSRNVLVEKLLEKLIIRYNDLLAGHFKNLHDEYNSQLFRKNRLSTFIFNNKEFKAFILSVHESGMILLETEEGDQKQFTFGELEMII